MKPELHTLSFPGAMVQRGFWLYVWRVQTPKGEVLYVGRTGDNSSPFATAPYTRMGQHLGRVTSQNALRKHLKKRGFEPEACEHFDLVSFGPIYPEASDPKRDRKGLFELHKPIRDIVGALERELTLELTKAGYDVVNTVKWRHEADLTLREDVREAFAVHFPKLTDVRGDAS